MISLRMADHSPTGLPILGLSVLWRRAMVNVMVKVSGCTFRSRSEGTL
jgi:hypothetical protein